MCPPDDGGCDGAIVPDPPKRHIPDSPNAVGSESSALTTEEEKQRRRLERFGTLCRAFYASSVGISSDGSAHDAVVVAGGRAALGALDDICRHSAPVEDRSVETAEERWGRRTRCLDECSARAAADNAPLFDALGGCGLHPPEAAIDLLLEDDALRGEYVRCRDRERDLAHRHGMQERADALLGYLAEAAEDKAARHRGRPDPLWTTRADVAEIRSALTDFARSHGGCVASHPILAGLRRLLERQVDEGDDAAAVRWTLDAAALAEGRRAGEGSGGTGSDAFVRETVDMLTCLLTRVVPSDEGLDGVAFAEADDDLEVGGLRGSYTSSTRASGHNCDSDRGVRGVPPDRASAEFPAPNECPRVIVFEVDRHLSNRFLYRAMLALPRMSELHARPSGTVVVVKGEARTNVHGYYDETDICFDIVENVINRFRSLCMMKSVC